MSTTYTVSGMTCEHCAKAVTAEVSDVSGVTGVQVDVAAGTVTVDGAFSDDEVRQAVDEAGYTVVAP